MSDTPTTAQRLIAFRDELAAAAFDPEAIDRLVRDAAVSMLEQEGLNVVAPARTARISVTGFAGDVVLERNQRSSGTC